ncbi:MAG: hypothetical protein M1354_03800 [Candidatus Marsarchaeota archaeon]|nr:hypothetical protein [Candidatus Marsarchaeota archaeon]
MARMKERGAQKRKASDKLVWLLYAALLLLIVVYALHNSIIIGIAVFALIVIILAIELKHSISKEGIRKSVIDIAIALGAVAAFYVAAAIILQTPSPIDVVSSCSMLPVLQRGDMVLIHGIGNMSSFLASHKVPVVNVSSAAFNSFIGNISSEFLAFYSYVPGDRSMISQFAGSNSPIGLYNMECLSRYSELGQPGNYYRCYVSGAAQRGNLIRYNYSIGNMSINNTVREIVYTSSITIANTVISENYSNPIVVYRTNGSDVFTGDIIHRVYAAIDSGGRYFLLTKGDNNPVLDIQDENYPPSANGIVGYYMGGIPYVGYLKLIISGQIAPIPQCGQVIQH